AVLLTAFHVQPEFRCGGIGRTLVQAVVKDLTRRGVRAIEAFGDAQPGERDNDEHQCVVPASFLSSVGFKTVRPDPRWPRLRLELRSGISWKEDVESALERLLGQVTVSTAETADVGRL
ncbi:MAG: GNAT family N-acetyltransferase, partial [Thermocrispum sp.]